MPNHLLKGGITSLYGRGVCLRVVKARLLCFARNDNFLSRKYDQDFSHKTFPSRIVVSILLNASCGENIIRVEKNL